MAKVKQIPKPPLRVVDFEKRLRDALMLLWLHAIIPDAEFEKAKKRLNKRSLTPATER